MAWQVLFDPRALRELDALDGPVRRRIWSFLYERLVRLDDPRSVGQALRGTELGDMWKYRVGDYRIFARIYDDLVEIVAVELGHRGRIYRG
jgi:mRNA interferase RelE/StbE